MGSSVVTGGNAFFDIGLLRMAGINTDLYRVNDYASDVLVLKLCSSDTVSKLLKLIEEGCEDPLDIAFVSMCLYFLHTFICAFNCEDISTEGRVTMIWSSLMWFTSLHGINDITKKTLLHAVLEVHS